jgi:hypothetical protein
LKPDRFLAEFRAEIDGNRLIGHAAVFNQTATLATGYERLASTAFDAALKDPETDVRALLNHDPTLVLGRQSAGTLRLGTDTEGLRFEVDLPDTSYARDLKELLSRGDITGASFGFIPGEDKFSTAPDGKQVRTHTSVSRLLDVSPVTWPAYEGASVALRHVEFPRVSARGQAARIRGLAALRRADK